jgi:type IV fimbrial biogenesis protein FimT
MSTHRRKQLGWSMVESLVGMAVAGVLAGAAVPKMTAIKDDASISGTTHELLTAMALARSEAVTRGTRVVVGPVDAGDWRHGWNVYVDNDDDGNFDSGADLLVRTYRVNDSQMRVEARFSAGPVALSFRPDGSVRRAGSNGLMLGHLVLRQGEAVRTICVHTMRVRVVRAGDCSG